MLQRAVGQYSLEHFGRLAVKFQAKIILESQHSKLFCALYEGNTLSRYTTNTTRLFMYIWRRLEVITSPFFKPSPKQRTDVVCEHGNGDADMIDQSMAGSPSYIGQYKLEVEEYNRSHKKHRLAHAPRSYWIRPRIWF